jgi:hypothetical protein
MMWMHILLVTGLFAQITPQYDPSRHESKAPEEVRLPNGKLQKDAILEEDYERTLKDVRELSRLSDELKTGVENSDKNVLSLQMLKKTEEIEKLAKRIHDRMKKY